MSERGTCVSDAHPWWMTCEFCRAPTAEERVIAQIGREEYERDLAEAAEEDGM